MLDLKHLLVPVDFSEKSRRTMRLVTAISGRFQSRITLLHVVAPPDYSLGAAELSAVALDRWNASQVSGAKSSLAAFLKNELAGYDVQRVVVEGDPARQIVEYAHEEGVNLVVLPTHGYGPFRRFILGSVTAKVLHDADCPVLTGCHIDDMSGDAPFEVRHVLAAIDLGPNSERTLSYASLVASEFGARLTIVHALPPLETSMVRYFDPAWRVELDRAARQQLEELRAGVHAKGEIVCEHGDPAKVVAAVAQTDPADLAIIGRAASTGLLGRMRENAYAIIRQAPCPVLSL